MQYFSCPVPSCKTPKRKVKRLRPLPPKWLDLPAETKDPIMKELREFLFCAYNNDIVGSWIEKALKAHAKCSIRKNSFCDSIDVMPKMKLQKYNSFSTMYCKLIE